MKERPTHLPALSAKARVLFHRKYYRPALKIYQQILSIAPNFLPDPRIGIGCCFWNLSEPVIAKKAWERSIAVVSCLQDLFCLLPTGSHFALTSLSRFIAPWKGLTRSPSAFGTCQFPYLARCASARQSQIDCVPGWYISYSNSLQVKS